MAIDGNIGGVRATIQQGKRAFNNVDFGPEVPSNIKNRETTIADWNGINVNQRLFIAGVHKWGDTTLTVAK